MYFFKHPIMYIYQDILDAKRRYSVSLRDCLSSNVKISVIGLEEFNNLFFSVFPGTPGFLNKSIIYSKTVIRYVQNRDNKKYPYFLPVDQNEAFM